MGTNTNHSLTSLVLFATISSSVISLPYESDMLIPKMNHQFSYSADYCEWKDNAFNRSEDYRFNNESLEKIQIIIDFSKRIIQNSKDIDSEFVDIVNRNFWELI